jgi:hypothetical protein
MRSKPGNGGSDQDADRRQHHDSYPYPLQNIQPHHGSAVEQDVACPEQEDDLVQRRIHRDIDQLERMRPYRYSASRKIAISGIRIFCAKSLAIVPIARITPQLNSVALEISIEADGST